MKLAKLSLAAIIVAGLASSSFAADTLADAFKNGKVNGELRAYYWDRTTDDANPIVSTSSTVGKGDASILNFGIILNYVTDSFYGLSMGATMQSNYAPFASFEAKNLFGNDEYGSGAVLSEGYINYGIGKTDIKVGRQFIVTPIVGGSNGRMVKESFEGATIMNKDIPATTLMAGYVSRYQGRIDTLETKDIGDIGDFRKVADFKGAKNALFFDGGYTAGVFNKSIPNLELIAQYATANDVSTSATAQKNDIDIYHLEAKYLLPMDGFKLALDATYRASSTSGVLAGPGQNLEGSYLVGRVGVKELSGFNVSFAYGVSDKTDDLVASLGGGGDNLYTNVKNRGGTPAYQANTKAYLLDGTYDMSKVGISGLILGAQYGLYDQGAITEATNNRTDLGETEYTTYGLNLVYAFSGALKGLTTTIWYEIQDRDYAPTNTKEDKDEVRIYVNYKF